MALGPDGSEVLKAAKSKGDLAEVACGRLCVSDASVLQHPPGLQSAVGTVNPGAK